jgi:hypothetical protein
LSSLGLFLPYPSLGLTPLSLSWISYLPGLPNISAIRTFRVIRPLKSISSNPGHASLSSLLSPLTNSLGLQNLVASILNSIPQLVGVLILLAFVFILFGIAGVQLFSGPQLHTRCRLTPYPVKLNWTVGLPFESYRCLDAPNFDLLDDGNWLKSTSPWATPQDCYWPVDETQMSFCRLNNGGMYKCLHGTETIPKENWTWCGSNFDAKGNPRFKNHRIMNEATFQGDLNWGYANYDNIFEALLTVFQVITLEGWTDLMYFAQDSINEYYAALLYVTLIVFGAFFCLNLLLAVLEDNFTHAKSETSSPNDTWKGFVENYLMPYFIPSSPASSSSSPSTAQWYFLKIQRSCQEISNSPLFDDSITVFIILNTIVLALDYYPQDPTFSNSLDFCNFIFSLIFLFEMLVKIISLNIFRYVADVVNLLDGIIVITSFIELITSPPVYIGGHSTASSRGSISALRGFRLFRIFKLISKWESMSLILSKVFKTMKDLGNFALLLFLILFIYTLIGMQFFANRFHFDDNGYPLTTIGSEEWAQAPMISRSNFDDFTHAFASVFQILTTENWNNIMYDCRKVAGVAGVIYPCSLIIIGDYIFMNLFLAILIGNFSNNEHDEEEDLHSSSSDDDEEEERGGKRERGSYEEDDQESGGGGGGGGGYRHLQIGNGNDENSSSSSQQHRRQSSSLFSAFSRRNRVVSPVSRRPSVSTGGAGGRTLNPRMRRMSSLESCQSQSESVASLPAGEGQDQHHPLPAPLQLTDDGDSTFGGHSHGHGQEEDGDDDLSDDDDDGGSYDENSLTDLELGPLSSAANESIFPLYPSHTLYLFGPDHPIRHFCAHLISNKKFDQIVLVIILISSISLALDNPLTNPDSLQSKILSSLDLILTFLFSIEMLIKIIALGFLFGESAYLRSSWNVLDFVVVIISFLSIYTATNSNLTSLRSLRALRALRPLRVINRAPGLKLVVNSMLSSIPDVMNVLALCFLFFFIFSIFCVNYFQGMFRSCGGAVFRNEIMTNSDYFHLLTFPKYWDALSPEEREWFGPNSTIPMSCEQYEFPSEPCCSSYPTSHHLPITSRMICECWGGVWQFYTNYQFDNVAQALLALFQMSTTEGWVDLMYTLVDTSGIDMQPIKDNQLEWIYFCIFFMLIGSYLALNIFVGVVIDNFNKMKAKVDGNLAFLTPEQQEWIHTQEIIKRLRPIKKIPRPMFWLTSLLYDICYHGWFEWFIMYSIIFNTIILAMVYFGQDDLYYGAFLDKMNTIFAFIFTLEAILKLIILRFHYFEDTWNRFDFFIVLGTNIGLLYLYLSGSKIGLAITILRTFRIARLLRLMNGTEKINQLLNTLLLTLPGLGNIAALLFLLFFIYGVMGVQLFAKIQYSGSLNSHTNFRNFGTALLSLLRFSTGETWDDFMYDTSRHADNCVINPSYNSSYCGFNDHIGCLPLNGCGSISIFPYMISFTIIISVVFINLFVGVILEGFSSADISEKTVKPDDFMRFCEHWALYDPHATCYITVEELESLVLTLFQPLGFGTNECNTTTPNTATGNTATPTVTKKELYDRIAAMNLPLFTRKKNPRTQIRERSKCVHFRDVLSGLSTEAIKRVSLSLFHPTPPLSLHGHFEYSL